MSFRLASLAAAVAATAVLAGCVVEQPRPRPVYYAPPPPPPPPVVVEVAPAPPPVFVENVPPPRPGWIWARGYYSWRGGRWVGVGGHWEPLRPGYRYVHPHWVQGPGGGWQFRAGVWVSG